MKGWFDSKERKMELVDEAKSWEMTPFLLNSRVKGKAGGVSCHNLVIGIFEGLGIQLPFESPKGSGGVGDQTKLANISKFLSQYDCFAQLDDSERPRPGDLVSFRTKTGEYHVGLMLPLVSAGSLRFIHCIKPWGVTVSTLKDPTYGGRLISTWMLKHESEWS